MEKLIQEFRDWNHEWYLYDSKRINTKPLDINDFINELTNKYVVNIL